MDLTDRISSVPILAFTDSRQLYNLVRSMKQVSDHRLRSDIFSIKERLEVGQIGEVMLADRLRRREQIQRNLTWFWTMEDFV